MSTHARPLADRLAAASDAQLQHLLRTRGVRADAPWEDFFDAAEALLEPASIGRGLAELPRPVALLLQAAVRGEADEAALAALASLGFVDGDDRVPPPVAHAVHECAAIADAPLPAEAAADPSEAAPAAEQALRTIGALADLLLAARQTPLSLVATGALSATEKRAFDSPVDLDDLREIAEFTGLAHGVDRELHASATAETWLGHSFAARWTAVASALREALPDGIRAQGGWLPTGAWADAYPWNPSWPARAARLLHLFELLGLRTASGTEPTWATGLRRGEAPDSTSLTALLPTEVDRLFLQNDLTAISPGPLQPALDNRLRTMTEHESAAQASTYRFTADSIARAVVDGETEQSILSFLRSISLTPLPQPLEYLVAQVSARHGIVRVGPDENGGTTVASEDADLLSAIEVDRNLRPLGLWRDGERLTSRVRAESVVWALADARYPATLVDQYGAPVPSRRRRTAPADALRSDDDYANLLARLRAQQGPDADAAWLDRELEAAVRARAIVIVEVAMPDGSSRELTLEASGLNGGRLRGRDKAADVERTLPVGSIRSVRVQQSL